MYVTNGSIVSSFAISTSLFLIVVSSVFTGTALPFVLAKLGVDPANAGTSIQVRFEFATGTGNACMWPFVEQSWVFAGGVFVHGKACVKFSR